MRGRGKKDPPGNLGFIRRRGPFKKKGKRKKKPFFVVMLPHTQIASPCSSFHHPSSAAVVAFLSLFPLLYERERERMCVQCTKQENASSLRRQRSSVRRNWKRRTNPPLAITQFLLQRQRQRPTDRRAEGRTTASSSSSSLQRRGERERERPGQT